MREIKFRIWDIKNKELLQWDDIWYSVAKVPDELVGGVPWIPFISLAFKAEDKYVVQQFTGLKDKNGKEIYDGDILKAKNDEWPWKEDCGWVCYYDSDAQYRIAWDLAGLSCEDNGSFAECYDIEVVGNIYEHTELLTNE